MPKSDGPLRYQVLYDYAYYFRANPTITEAHSSGWFGRRVTLPPALCKQRWETNAAAAVDAQKKANLRLSTNALLCYYPHFQLLDQAPRHRKSDWQFSNLGRSCRFILDPRAHVHLELITSLHKNYQKKVNMMDRVPTDNGPTGHDLPRCLQSTFETYAPLWARLAGDGWLDEPEMRSVKKTIADLEKYNAYHVEIDDAWVKLSVADCVALEAARLAGKASLDLHGHCFDFVTRTAAGDTYISSATSSDGTDVRVRWSPYRVQREGGEKGDFYSRVELLENTKDQLFAGLKKGNSKFLELHAAYHEAPVSFNFIFTTWSKDFAAHVCDVYKRSATSEEGSLGVEAPAPPGNLFQARCAAMTPADLRLYETRLVDWTDHLGLSDGEWRASWAAAVQSSSSDLQAQHPEFCAKVKRTAGALGHTSYIAETLWAIHREVAGYHDSNMTSSSYVKFKFNIIAPLNQKTKYIRESKESVQERRLSSDKSIRVQSSHTNYQRVALCKEIRLFFRNRYQTTPRLSRYSYRNKKKSIPDQKRLADIERVGKKKHKKLTEEMLELISGQLSLMENERAYQDAKETNISDAVSARLLKPSFWGTSNVGNADISIDARAAFPQLQHMLVLRRMSQPGPALGSALEWSSRRIQLQERWVDESSDVPINSAEFVSI